MRTSIILLLFLTFIVFFNACISSPEDILRNNIEDYLMQNLHDPDSYEFVALELVHVYTHRENIEYRIPIFESSVEFRKNRIEYSENRINRAKRSISQPYANVEFNEGIISDSEESIAEYEQEIERYERILKELDSLKNNLGADLDEETAYRYQLTFRANNAMGALVLQEYLVQTDTDLNVLHFAESEGQLLATPNMLPEYHEIMDL